MFPITPISFYQNVQTTSGFPSHLPVNPETGTRKYYPVPPILPTPFEYQNVNADPQLRRNVTEFYVYKISKWIKSDPDFAKFKRLTNHFNTKQGEITIYNLLKEFVAKSNINWYDIRDNYQLVKDYFKYKLSYL
jgi:hypothetical protein